MKFLIIISIIFTIFFVGILISALILDYYDWPYTEFWSLFWPQFIAALIVALFSIIFVIVSWRITDNKTNRDENEIMIGLLTHETLLNLFRINRLIKYIENETDTGMIIGRDLELTEIKYIPHYLYLRTMISDLILNKGSLRFFTLSIPYYDGTGKRKKYKSDAFRVLLLQCINDAIEIRPLISKFDPFREIDNIYQSDNIGVILGRLEAIYQNYATLFYTVLMNSKLIREPELKRIRFILRFKRAIIVRLSSEINKDAITFKETVLCWKNDSELPDEKVIELESVLSKMTTY